MTTVIENCAIATVDAEGTEHVAGHIVIDDGRITAVGAGSGPAADTKIDGGGCLATPGLAKRSLRAKIVLLDKELLTGAGRREADLLARVPLRGGGSLLVHVEYQRHGR